MIDLDSTGMFCPQCALGNLTPLQDFSPSGGRRLKCANGHRCNENTYSESPAVRKPKILLTDIETAPMLVYSWSLYPNFIAHDQVFRDWHILTWAGRWLGESETLSDSMFLHDEYEPWSDNDKSTVESLYKLFDEADWIIGQNLDRFDIKKMNTRFLMHGLPPCSPYKTIDTLKIAKSQFSFTSNKLDFLGEKLCGMPKIKTDHQLWRDCLAGKEKAWREMLTYNIRDIDVLEAVYFKLRAWDKRHPNFMMFTDSELTLCPVCGSHNIKETGKTVKTMVSEFVGMVCEECGHHSRQRNNVRQTEAKGGVPALMTAQ